MFYCEFCREENKWPYSFRKSLGACELCNRYGPQYDVTLKYLPDKYGNIPEYLPLDVIYPHNAWADIKIKKDQYKDI